MKGALGASIALLCAAMPICGQYETRSFGDISRIDDLISEGKYSEAQQALAEGLRRARLLPGRDDPAPWLAYLGRFSIETGNLDRAEEAIQAAERQLVLRPGGGYWAPAVMRERAALLFARGTYESALEAASKASRLAEQGQYFRIRAAYCKALAALASLYLGDLANADRLIHDSLRAVPGGVKKGLFFAPRILFAACEIQAANGNASTAQAYCLRGLQISSASRHRTRDLILGNLALARAYIFAGNFVESRQAVINATEIIGELFGKQHQDTVEAMKLLVQLDLKDGNSELARLRAAEALKLASTVMGDAAPLTVRLRGMVESMDVNPAR